MISENIKEIFRGINEDSNHSEELVEFILTKYEEGVEDEEALEAAFVEADRLGLTDAELVLSMWALAETVSAIIDAQEPNPN